MIELRRLRRTDLVIVGGYTLREGSAVQPIPPQALWPDGARGIAATANVASPTLDLANDSKGARSCRRPHHPPGVQSGAPAVPLQGGPFERPGDRYGQCGPIGSPQDAA